MVGLPLGLALAQGGLKVRVVDAAPPAGRWTPNSMAGFRPWLMPVCGC